MIVNDFEPTDFKKGMFPLKSASLYTFLIFYDKFMQSQVKTMQTDYRICEVSHVWGDPMFSLKRNQLYTKVLLT